MSRGVSKPRGVPEKIAQAVAIHEAEPSLTVNAIAERCGISRTSVVKGLAAARQDDLSCEHVAQTWRATDLSERSLVVLRALFDIRWVRPMDIGGSDSSHHSDTLNHLVKVGLVEREPRGGYTKTAWRYRRTPAGRAASCGEVSADRLTVPQIDGLETWLQAVDPAEPVIMPRLVIDAVQALIEEVRERRSGDAC